MSYSTWNGSDKGDYIVLSNDDLTAEFTPASNQFNSVRSNISVSTGKVYFEIYINSSDTGDTPSSMAVGVCTSSPAMDGNFTDELYGWGYYSYNGDKVNYGNYDNFGDTFQTADVIGIAIDVDSGHLWFSKNGVWQGSGNPVTDANPTYTGVTGDIFAAAAMFTNDKIVTLRSDPADFTYASPTGFDDRLEGEAEILWPIAINGEFALSGEIDVVPGNTIFGEFALSGSVDVVTPYNAISGELVLSGGIKSFDIKKYLVGGELILSGGMEVVSPSPILKMQGAFVLGGYINSKHIIGNTITGNFILSGDVNLFNKFNNTVNGNFALGGNLILGTDGVICILPEYNSSRWS